MAKRDTFSGGRGSDADVQHSSAANPRLSLPLVALVLSLVLVAGFSVWLVCAYGLEGYATQLVPGFAAALLAFVIALAWERDQEVKKTEKSAESLLEQQVIEVQRRLGAVRDELSANLKSLGDLDQNLGPTTLVLPAASRWRLDR